MAETIPNADSAHGPANGAGEAIRTLVALHQLNVEVSLAADRQEYVFAVLNRTINLCRYDRAVLFDLTGAKPSLLGISGQSSGKPRTELSQLYLRLANALIAPAKPAVLSREAFEESAHADSASFGRLIPGVTVFWLPLLCRDRLVAGLWLERWGAPWREGETKILESLGRGYAATWEKFDRETFVEKWSRRLLGRKRTAAMLALLLAVLVFWRAPLRIVAPCEVVPKEPFVVTAPLDGVIADVQATPGCAVAKGDPLFAYDKRVPLEERNIARQQVEIIRSGLERAQVQAFSDAKARSESALLALRLKQEEIRLRLAEHNVSRLEVTADHDGVVVIDDPNAWRGRPVVVGQRVLMIVEPEKTKLRIWLPEDDNVRFNRERPAMALLNAMPDAGVPATLVYVAREVAADPKGEPRIMAEAEWETVPPGLKMGQQGVAVCYGKNVSLLYWLLRKPFYWFRATLGV